MRKKFVTSALTLGVATALVAGNGVVSTFAYSGDDAKRWRSSVNISSPKLHKSKMRR
jgi:hypothetical protein